MLISPNVMLLFGEAIWEEDLSGKETMKAFLSMCDYPLVDNLTGAMTYPELVDAVGDKAQVAPPVVNEAEGGYFTGFMYGEYELLYFWDENPDTEVSIGALMK